MASNVLDTLEPDLLDFLLATCITKQICSGLATTLTDNQRSQSVLEEIEKRDLFLRRTDGEGSWFQYHHLFADYLLHRLERDAQDRIPELHRRAARWFSEHQMLSQAVDHLILAGDALQAIDAVEQAGPGLNEQSQMNTLIGLAAKLPPQHAAVRPRLQVDLAWANVVLRRLAAVEDALRLADLGVDSLPADQAADLRAEMDLIGEVIAAFQDRVDPSAAAAMPFKLALTEWKHFTPGLFAGRPMSRLFGRSGCSTSTTPCAGKGGDTNIISGFPGRSAVSYGYCFAAIAANEQLDLAGAEAHLRHAIRIALLPSGRPTYVAKLAGSLLGALLYERDRLDEAETLLDDAYELGAEGGLVEFMLAAFGTGARLKIARGDKTAAENRLAEGLSIARELQLPRLEAGLVYEQVRLGAMSAKKSVRRWLSESSAAVNKHSTEPAISQLNSGRTRKSDCSSPTKRHRQSLLPVTAREPVVTTLINASARVHTSGPRFSWRLVWRSPERATQRRASFGAGAEIMRRAWIKSNAHRRGTAAARPRKGHHRST